MDLLFPGVIERIANAQSIVQQLFVKGPEDRDPRLPSFPPACSLGRPGIRVPQEIMRKTYLCAEERHTVTAKKRR